jgi:hypothetical protein
MWITFRLVRFDRCQDAAGEPKGLVGQQPRDLNVLQYRSASHDYALQEIAAADNGLGVHSTNGRGPTTTARDSGKLTKSLRFLA